MRWSIRLVVAFIAGAVAGLLCAHSIRTGTGGDFTWVWRGARDLLAGHNPYRHPGLGWGHPYPANAPLFYPLPALLLALPLAPLSAQLAASLFIGVSFGALAFIVSGGRHWRLLVLASPCAYAAIHSAQWSPLLVAIGLTSAAPVGALLKPTLGIPLGLNHLTLRGLVAAAVIGIVSLLILPSWPIDLLHNLELDAHRHTIPLLTLSGVPLLVAARCWRRRPARLLLLLAAMPQRMLFYDQLPLLLIPETDWQMGIAVAAQWAGFLCWRALGGVESRYAVDDVVTPWLMLSCYLPALALVLWQALEATATSRSSRQDPSGARVTLSRWRSRLNS